MSCDRVALLGRESELGEDSLERAAIDDQEHETRAQHVDAAAGDGGMVLRQAGQLGDDRY